MSKAKRRDRNDTRPHTPRFLSPTNQRDDLYIANDLSDRVFEPVQRSLPDQLLPDLIDNYYSSVRSTLQDVEDRRHYTPVKGGRSQRPAQSSRRHSPRVTHSPILSRSSPIAAFKYPAHVALCVRRHQRTEVLHALGKTGKGSRFNKKPRRNSHSNVRC